jgi:cytoskeleton protein RodZ
MADSTEQDRAQHADHGPSPGARLRAARERKGLTLAEAADALRLDHWLVEALERDDFKALGAPVFVKGHLRKYATLTGEPPDDILLAYHQRAGVQEALPLLDRAALVRPAGGTSSGVPVAAVLGLLLLGGAAGAWWWYEQPVERPVPVGGLAATNGAALAASSIDAEAQPDAPAAAADGASSTASVFETPAEPALESPSPALRPSTSLTTPEETPATDSEAPAAGSTVPGTSTGAPVGGAPPPTGVGETPAAPPATLPAAGPDAPARPEAVEAPATARAGEHVVVLSFDGDSWVEVRDGGGARLYYGLGEAGSRRTLRGLPPFEIFLGRYVDVRVEMDGQPRAVPAGSVRGNTARFTLDPT